ncbi:MAG: hypothetical protein WBP82_03075 [Leuconostoc mesenteroides]
MGLVKASDVKPGDKFNIMGMEMYVKNIQYIGNTIHFTFENTITIIVTFNNDAWVSNMQ